MAEPRCIITGDKITPENNSRAHIIPSALGGRLKPLDILSKRANALLGDKFDLPLIQAFQGIMTFLNGSRDRGKNRPVRMTDENGRTYVVNFGEPLELTKPEYQETPTADGAAFEIKARDLKELRTLLGRVKAQRPEFDIDEAMRHAVEMRVWPDGMLAGQIQFGPRVVFPALFASASIFAAYHKHAPHPELKGYVSSFDSENPALPPDTFFFLQQQRWVSAPGQVTHIVALLASAARKQMLIYFELFSAVPVAILLPYNGATDNQFTYAVDVLSGAEVQATIHEEVLRGLAWQATHQLGDPELYRLMQDRLGRLIRLSQELARNAQLEAIRDRAFGSDEDGPLTPQKMIDGIGEIAEFVLLQWRHPLTTLPQMEEDLRAFDQLCSGLARLISWWRRPTFRARLGGHRNRLNAAVARKRTDNNNAFGKSSS